MGIHDFVELVMGVPTVGILFYFILFKRSHLIGPITDFLEHGALPQNKSLNMLNSTFCGP
jgi:hypothetical protein